MSAARRSPSSAGSRAKATLDSTRREMGEIRARAELEAQRFLDIAETEADRHVRRREEHLMALRAGLERSATRSERLLRVIAQGLSGAAEVLLSEAAKDQDEWLLADHSRNQPESSGIERGER